MNEVMNIVTKYPNVQLVLSITGKDQMINTNELPKNVIIYYKRLDKAIFSE